MTPKNRHIYEFGEYRLLPTENILEMGGQVIPLKPKAFSALVHLVDNHGKLVEKSDLLDQVWGDSFVEEASVSKCIWELRAALGDDPKEGRYIQTVPKRGYRFVADVKVLNGQPILVEIPVPAVSNGNGRPNVIAISHHGGRAAEVIPDPSQAVEELPARIDPLPAARPNIEFVPKAAVRTRRWPIYSLAAGALVVLAIFAAFYLRGAPTPSSAGVQTSLAVLPLRPVNARDRNPSVEFAITEALILKISEGKDIDVKRLFAVRKFTDLNEDPIEAGRELKVDYVLSSTYQMAEGYIRVTSQLVNVRTGDSEKIFRSESETGNLFHVQDVVSNEIGNEIFSKFGKPADTYISNRGTDDERAYSLYHEAVYLVDRYTLDDSLKAVDLLDKATADDPNFAEAWAMKAQAYCLFAHQGGGAPSEIFAKAGPDLERALAIDGNNAIALAVRGIINRDYHWNLADAYRDLNRAIEIDPNLTLAHRILAGVYYRDGKFAEAVAEGGKAVDLNPAGIWDKWFLADYQIAAGHTDLGITSLKQLEEIAPGFKPTYYSLWKAYASRGDTVNAYQYFIKNKRVWQDTPSEIERFQKIFETDGWTGVLKAELSLMRSNDPANAYSTRKFYIAELAAQLGETDLAFQYLEEAARFHVMEFSYVRVDPLLNPLRNDPRYFRLISQTKL